MQAYCMKCRTKREMKDTKAITMKNGRPDMATMSALLSLAALTKESADTSTPHQRC